MGVDSYHTEFLTGLRQGLDLILSGNQVIVDTTVRTLRLAAVATGVAALIGMPLGCVLGLGRSRPSRAVLRLAGSTTRIPPVTVGIFVLILVQVASPWGGGPLAGLHWMNQSPSAYMAQTLLVIPIMTALTAAAVRKVPAELLEQARAFGAGAWQTGLLALREARRAVFAAAIVALGVAITAIGALAVVGASPGDPHGGPGGGIPEPPTLALGAFDVFKQDVVGSPPPGANVALYPSHSVAVAYATILLGLFVLISIALTWLQQTRRATWIQRS